MWLRMHFEIIYTQRDATIIKYECSSLKHNKLHTLHREIIRALPKIMSEYLLVLKLVENKWNQRSQLET